MVCLREPEVCLTAFEICRNDECHMHLKPRFLVAKGSHNSTIRRFQVIFSPYLSHEVQATFEITANRLH
jgi:hypothetical protein